MDSEFLTVGLSLMFNALWIGQNGSVTDLQTVEEGQHPLLLNQLKREDPFTFVKKSSERDGDE